MGQQRAVADFYLPYPVERLEILLCRSLGLNEAHAGPAARFTDRCSIVSVVLVAVEIGLDLVGRQQSHGVTELADLTIPVVRTATSLQRYLAGFELGEILQNPVAFKGLAQHHSLALVDSVQLKDLLCDIETDSCDFHFGPSRLFVFRWS